MSNGSKRCSRCGEVKTLDRFHGHWRSKDGRTSACKDCRGEWTPEKDRESKRRWREQNPDKQREAQRRYVEQNLEKVSAAKSRYSLEAGWAYRKRDLRISSESVRRSGNGASATWPVSERRLSAAAHACVAHRSISSALRI